MPRKTDDEILRSLSKVFQNAGQQSRLQPTRAKELEPEERRFLQLKVSIKDIQPPIWRSFVVPNDLTLFELHYAIMVLMDWTGFHSYEFRVGKKPHLRTFTTLLDDYDFYGTLDGGQENANHFDLTFLKKKGMKFLYIYDFGDSWIHEIVVENSNYDYSGQQPVFVLSGMRNAPPEDCGGVYGYFEVLAALKNPKEHSDMTEFLSWEGGFDPEQFSIDKCNAELAYRFSKDTKKQKKAGKKTTPKK